MHVIGEISWELSVACCLLSARSTLSQLVPEVQVALQALLFQWFPNLAVAFCNVSLLTGT